MSVTAPSGMLGRLLERAVGYNLAAGGLIFDDGAWWCRSSTRSEVIVVCRRESIERVSDVGGPDLVDRSDEYEVFNIVGRRCEAVAAELGVFGASENAETALPFSQRQIRRWA